MAATPTGTVVSVIGCGYLGAVHAASMVALVYDPKARTHAEKRSPQLNFCDSTREAAAAADAVLMLTEWPEFIELDPAELGAIVASRRIFDGRNALDASAWTAAGWVYRCLGRPGAGS